MDLSQNNPEEFDDFPEIGGLLVSNMVAVDRLKPVFMYREKPSRPEDSGWRIFSGLESEAYNEDSDNAGIYNPSTILAIDPSLADLLLCGYGSVFERESVDSPWYRVTDFVLEDDYLVEHALIDRWGITINNLFERRMEEDDLFYTTGDKSVRITVWDSENQDKAELYQDYESVIKNREPGEPEILEVFEFSDADILRIGYRIKESDEDREYDVIYGFSIIDNQALQIVLYYDDPDDQSWAVDTWRSVRLN